MYLGDLISLTRDIHVHTRLCKHKALQIYDYDFVYTPVYTHTQAYSYAG